MHPQDNHTASSADAREPDADAGRYCPSIADWQKFLMGTLTNSHLDELASHLENCPHCETVISKVAGQPHNVDPVVRVLRKMGEHGTSPKMNTAKASTDDHTHETPATHVRSIGHEPVPDLTEAPIPKHIGGFEILKLLGAGGFGRVYLA